MERFLDGRPILARPVSIIEKTIKLVRRRPAAALLMAVLVVSTMSFFGYGAWKNRQLAQALAAKEASLQRAEHNFRKALDAAARRITRSGRDFANPLREELKFMEQVRQQSGDSPEARYEQALASGWAGYIYGELNEAAAAERAFADSIDELDRLCTEFPAVAEYQRDRATFVGRRAVFLSHQGDDARTRAECQRVVALFDELLAASPQDPDYRWLAGAQYNNLAIVAGRLGEDALPYHERAAELRTGLAKEFPDNTDFQYDLAVSQLNLSAHFLRLQKYAKAEQILRETLQQLNAVPPKLQREIEYRRSLASVHLNLGNALQFQERADDSGSEYRAGIQILEQLVVELPQSVPLRKTLIDALLNLGKQQLSQPDNAIPLPTFERIANLYTQLAREFPEEATHATEAARYRRLIAELKNEPR